MGALSPEDAASALQEPVQEQDLSFTEAALAEVVRVTPAVVKKLDGGFFRVRLDRLTAKEKDVLHAMATLGPGPHRTSEVAEKSGMESSSGLSTVRASLIKKGMIYSPSHGDSAFTVPLFDKFMLRAMLEKE